MKTTVTKISFWLCLIAIPASANTMILTGSDTENARQANLSYTLVTLSNNTISGSSGFTPSSGATNLSTGTGVNYSSYLNTLPLGYTVTGATLNFSGLFSTPTTSSSLSGGTQFYQPVFSSSLSTYTVTITSTLANATVTGSSATNYNLWPAFSADILAGHAINVSFSVVDTFGANTSTYANNKKSGNETFDVTSTGNFSALSAGNSLSLAYTAPAPEPGTFCLGGLALFGLGLVRKRRT